ncbi:hypothetical protein SRHO_G00031960 [Serrasalmus rhombeus]
MNRYAELGKAAAVRKVRLYTQRTEQGVTNSNGAQCVEEQPLSAVQGAGHSSWSHTQSSLELSSLVSLARSAGAQLSEAVLSVWACLSEAALPPILFSKLITSINWAYHTLSVH